MRLENGDRISDLLVVDFHVAGGLAKCKMKFESPILIVPYVLIYRNRR